MNELWKSVITELEGVLPPQNFATWIKPIRARRFEGNELTLEVPNRFFADWLRDNDYLAIIERVVGRHAERAVSISFAFTKSAKPHIRDTRKSEPPRPRLDEWQTRARELGLNRKYTFDSFVVGGSNQFAHAASLAVAEKSQRTYNPLFIYGGVGLGKTHLLNAIGNFKLATYPDIKVCYVHSEGFINELIRAIQNKTMPEFRAKYRQMDILLMDDIQFIAGKERTQEEFFHTFNALYESHKNIVVTSDKFPKEIPGLEARMRSRFEWGLIADIQAPDLETKVAILQKKAELESIPLPYEVATFLAKNFTSNIRELEGSLIRIAAFANLTHAPITMELAREVLKDFIREADREITVEKVLKTVSLRYQVTVTELRGKRRTKAISFPRQVAMYLSRELTPCSFPEIGQKIGGRDHSTVMYAYGKIRKALAVDSNLERQVADLRSTLTS